MKNDPLAAAFGLDTVTEPNDPLLAAFAALGVKGGKTPADWQDEIHKKYPHLFVRYISGADGNGRFPDGLWAIETDAEKRELFRYVDAGQLEEIWRALDTERFWSLVRAEGVEIGPRVVGRPPIDPFGREIIKGQNLGDYGGEDEVCKHIEGHDKVIVEYKGSDEMWPDGCWAIESAEFDDQYVNREQLHAIAHSHLNMPWRGCNCNYTKKRAKELKAERRPTQNSDDPLAAMFDVVEEDVDIEAQRAGFDSLKSAMGWEALFN